MKLYGIFIVFNYQGSGENKPYILKYAIDLSTFNFFQRKSVEEFLKFTSELLFKKTSPGTRSSVTQDNYLCHTFVRYDGLGGVLFSDQEYPKRVAQTLLSKVLEQFINEVPKASWDTVIDKKSQPLNFNSLPELLNKYQNPKEADALTRMEQDLDETKIILHNTIESVLERGEKLDDLVSKSDQLSANSKAFYKTARKTNQCSC